MIHAFINSGSKWRPQICLALWLVAQLGATACLNPRVNESKPEGPRHVVFITAQGLRPDALSLSGPSGTRLTPHLDALFASASASGSAISPSPDTAPALASAVTGLPPWQHQVLHRESPPPAGHLYTLAESFRDRGFATTAISSGRLLRRNPGYLQGFQKVLGLQKEAQVRSYLAGISQDPTFTWIHFSQPQPPYFRNRSDRNPRRRRALLAEMERYRNPAIALPAAQRDRFWRGYLRNVSWLDQELGSLLDAFRSSGQWDKTLVVFVSLFGEEFGEHGQLGHSNNLGRAVLEVPWALKLPASMDPGSLQVPGRPAVGRLISTMLAATGQPPPPALARPLFEEGDDGALSELYLGNGVNRFSLMQGDLQWVRTVRFARPERGYYLARRQLLGDPRVGGDKVEAEDVFQRLEEAFESSQPFSGPGTAVETELYRWNDAGASPIDDPPREARRSAALAKRWGSSLDSERSPAEERRFR